MSSLNISTTYRQDLKSKIVATATTLFHKNGIKSVKMDDIASSLSISKRTLYEIYANKEELLLEVAAQHDRVLEEHFKSFAAKGADVMDVLIEYFRAQMAELLEINPNFFGDLQKYPRLLAYLEAQHDKRTDYYNEFVARGVKEGYFLETVNGEIARRTADAVNNYIMTSQLYLEYSMTEIFKTVLCMFLRGICTLKGIKRLDSFMNQE